MSPTVHKRPLGSAYDAHRSFLDPNSIPSFKRHLFIKHTNYNSSMGESSRTLILCFDGTSDEFDDTVSLRLVMAAQMLDFNMKHTPEHECSQTFCRLGISRRATLQRPQANCLLSARYWHMDYLRHTWTHQTPGSRNCRPRHCLFSPSPRHAWVRILNG